MIMIKEANLSDKAEPKILVVDDLSMDRQFIIKSIRQSGFNNEILEAHNTVRKLCKFYLKAMSRLV